MSLDILDKIEKQSTPVAHITTLGINLLLMYGVIHLADYVWRMLGCPC